MEKIKEARRGIEKAKKEQSELKEKKKGGKIKQDRIRIIENGEKERT